MSPNAVIAESEAKEITGKCRIRASPGGYVNVLFFLTFAAGFLAYLQLNLTSLGLLVAAWTIIPILLWFDRIEFDGKNLRRTGAAARLLRLAGHSARLKIADIETVETNSLRALRSGGQVYYRYRCEIYGDGQSFVFATGGKAFRQMVKHLFPLIHHEKLDQRSCELRDFLVEPNFLKSKIKNLKLPSSDVVENVLPKLRRAKRRTEKQIEARLETIAETHADVEQQSRELQQVANELRIAGNLAQAVEAFRRALVKQPENPGLLRDFARGLHSYAGATRSKTLLRRSVAALRLAARRAGTDSDLLVRIGENYLNIGNFKAAAKAFRQALEFDAENFRAECGLAEIGLQDGKVAHVVHHYQSAARAAEDAAAKKWARGEAEYFALLNQNADYMETEVARINWASNAAHARQIGWRLTFAGLVCILAGSFASESLVSIGWSISATTLFVWAISGAAETVLAERFPLIEDEEDD